MLGMRLDFEAEKSPPFTLHGGLSRFQPRNLLPFQTWGIFRKEVDSCKLECYCSKTSYIKFSDNYNERTFHSFTIAKKSLVFVFERTVVFACTQLEITL